MGLSYGRFFLRPPRMWTKSGLVEVFMLESDFFHENLGAKIHFFFIGSKKKMKKSNSDVSPT